MKQKWWSKGRFWVFCVEWPALNCNAPD